jgi:DNA-binding transcriptional ArsR family regulator
MMNVLDSFGQPASQPAFDDRALETVLAAVEPTRLKILLMLGRRKSMSVGEVAAEFKITRPAVSHHLKVLKNCGLVTASRDGQEIYYTVQMQRIVGILRVLANSLEACCYKG